MISNRMKTIAARWWIVVIAGWAFATSAPAQPARSTSIDGVYNGSYSGDQGPTKFKLTLTVQDNGTFSGVFTLYLPEGSGTKADPCDVTGLYVPANRMFQLLHGKWETLPPRRR